MNEIFEASRKGNINRINELLDSGVDVNSKHPKDNSTSLMFSSKYSNTTSNIETVKLLLDRGADVNLQTNDGWSALMWAARYSSTTSNIETVKLLLDRGANPFAKNSDGDTIPDLCPPTECEKIISKAIWNRLYQTDKKLAIQYSRSGNGNFPVLPKDVWELILLNKRQQELCKNLTSYKNREVLWYFAEMLNIPINEGLTKGQLCGLIARYLAYGQYEDEKRGKFVRNRLNEDKRKIIEVAQRFGIDTNESTENILRKLAELMKD